MYFLALLEFPDAALDITNKCDLQRSLEGFSRQSVVYDAWLLRDYREIWCKPSAQPAALSNPSANGFWEGSTALIHFNIAVLRHVYGLTKGELMLHAVRYILFHLLVNMATTRYWCKFEFADKNARAHGITELIVNGVTQTRKGVVSSQFRLANSMMICIHR